VSEAIVPFRCEIPDAVLDDLRDRLGRTRWPDELNDADWSYGTDQSTLKELCAYWRDGFDWRREEARLNRFEQFTTSIDGLRLHFIHARSPEPNALPLVVTHGWPGSVFEFLDIIDPLRDPAAHGGDPADAFHVICPSIPGYGFSEAAREPGMHPRKVSETVASLMKRLGYERYGAQGGDWGSMISQGLGMVAPDHCVGIHVNMIFAPPPKDVSDPMEGVSEAEKQNLVEAQRVRNEEMGYYRIQSTKPQTLGTALNDSPAGLASWIVEKFRTWSDCGGKLESVYTKDQLLANITLYWVTGTITSSVRLYCETVRAASAGRIEHRVPVGCAIFPGELVRPPRRWVEHHFDLRRWTEMPRGGHFAAMEQPELLVEDVRAFFRELR
jgi:microsomal epoxide hydrolase